MFNRSVRVPGRWLLPLFALVACAEHGDQKTARVAIGWASEPQCGNKEDVARALRSTYDAWDVIAPVSSRQPWRSAGCWVLLTARSDAAPASRVGQGASADEALRHAASQLRSVHPQPPSLVRVDVPFDLLPYGRAGEQRELSSALRGLIYSRPGAFLLFDELKRHRLIERRERTKEPSPGSPPWLELELRSASLRRDEEVVEEEESGAAQPQPSAPDQRLAAIGRFRTFGIALDRLGRQIELLDGLEVPPGPPTPESLAESEDAAADFLLRAVQPSGRFRYEFSAATGRDTPTYNRLRHAGTLIAGYQSLERLQRNPTADHNKRAERVRGGLAPAREWLRAQLVACVRHGEPASEVTRGSNNKRESLCLPEGRTVSIGGNGLAILALLGDPSATDRARNVAAARRLAVWLLEHMAPDGHFPHHAWNYPTGIASDQRSEYYPGEAALGLAWLAAATDNETYARAARSAVSALRDSYRSTPNAELPHDHWLAMAMAALRTDQLTAEDATYAIRLADAIAATQAEHSVTTEPGWHLAGAFGDSSNSTPAASRGEALGALHSILVRQPDTTADAKRVLEPLCRSVEFVLRSQLRPARALFYPEASWAVGGILRGPEGSTLRIDFTQHALSSALGLSRILQSQSTSCPEP